MWLISIFSEGIIKYMTGQTWCDNTVGRINENEVGRNAKT